VSLTSIIIVTVCVSVSVTVTVTVIINLNFRCHCIVIVTVTVSVSDISDILRLTVTVSTCTLADVSVCLSVCLSVVMCTVMCQLSTWSSTSGSSCQSSSVEIKEFFCDDELIDSSDWTLGRHVILQADHNMSVIDSRAPAYTRAVLTADNTLSAGMLLQSLIMLSVCMSAESSLHVQSVVLISQWLYSQRIVFSAIQIVGMDVTKIDISKKMIGCVKQSHSA